MRQLPEESIVRNYLPLTAVLLAFWFGGQLGAGDDGLARDGRFDTIRANRIVFVGLDDDANYRAELDCRGLHVTHPDTSRGMYSSRGLAFTTKLKPIATISAVERQVKLYDGAGAARVVLGVSTSHANKNEIALTRAIGFVRILDENGKPVDPD